MAGLSTLDWEGANPNARLFGETLTQHIQFRARNWGGNQGQISRARLAVQIAKRIAESITVRLLFPWSNVKLGLNCFRQWKECNAPKRVGSWVVTAFTLTASYWTPYPACREGRGNRYYGSFRS